MRKILLLLLLIGIVHSQNSDFRWAVDKLNNESKHISAFINGNVTYGDRMRIVFTPEPYKIYSPCETAMIVTSFYTTATNAQEKIEQLSWYNLQELLEDDNLTYKIIKSCVSLNSAVTELTKEEHPELANEFFKSANYLYPFGILVLKKIKNISNKEAEKDFLYSVDNLTNDYMKFMIKNGETTKSFIKGTFLGDDITYCNEIRSAIEITLSESSKN